MSLLSAPVPKAQQVLVRCLLQSRIDGVDRILGTAASKFSGLILSHFSNKNIWEYPCKL